MLEIFKLTVFRVKFVIMYLRSRNSILTTWTERKIVFLSIIDYG